MMHQSLYRHCRMWYKSNSCKFTSIYIPIQYLLHPHHQETAMYVYIVYVIIIMQVINNITGWLFLYTMLIMKYLTRSLTICMNQIFGLLYGRDVISITSNKAMQISRYCLIRINCVMCDRHCVQMLPLNKYPSYSKHTMFTSSVFWLSNLTCYEM